MKTYDELVNSLRICAEGEHCDKCGKWEANQTGGLNVCQMELCTEAADAIEELQEKLIIAETDLSDFIDAIAWKEHFDILTEQDCTIPKWIPVEERLPEDTQRCIVVSKYGNTAFAIYTGKGFQCPYRMGKVTHWMPLPDRPAERNYETVL